MATQKTETTPRHLQLAFITLTVATFVLQTALTLYSVLMQLSTNQNLSSYLFFFVQALAMPLAFAAIAWWLVPGRASRVARIFNVLIAVIAGSMLAGLVSQAGAQITAGGDYNNFAVYEVVSSVVTIALYTIGLLLLRRTSK